jgi:hypothetical protein
MGIFVHNMVTQFLFDYIALVLAWSGLIASNICIHVWRLCDCDAILKLLFLQTQQPKKFFPREKWVRESLKLNRQANVVNMFIICSPPHYGYILTSFTISVTSFRSRLTLYCILLMHTFSHDLTKQSLVVQLKAKSLILFLRFVSNWYC